MAQLEKKSVTYYVLLIALVFIGVSSLYALIWQPSFREGYISIQFGRGSLVFSLWKFVSECFALVTFFHMVYRTFKSNFERKPFILSNIWGISAIGFCILLLSDFAYTETSFGPSNEDRSFIYFIWPFLGMIIVVAFTLCFLFFKRRRGAQ